MSEGIALFEAIPFFMRIDDSRIISKISKDLKVNHLEAEKAIDCFYKLVSKEISSGDFNIIDVKHLGKFKPRPTKDGVSHTS